MNEDSKQVALALLLATLLVASISWTSNSIERPAHDGKFYVDMARNGVLGNPRLTAPFAYRPAVPMAVGLLERGVGVPAVTGFRALAHLGAVLGLFGAFLLARFVSSDARTALLVMIATGLSYFHVKFPLFFFPLVDVEAAPLFLLALWAALTHRFGLCLLTGCIGLFFKEFLAVPLAVACVVLARDWLRDSTQRAALRWIAAIVVLGALCAALPRATLPIAKTVQFIDPIRAPETLSRLWEAPLSPGRLANFAFAFAAYWLPVAMIASRERARLVWGRLGEWRLPLGVTLAGVMLLAMYGGTNLALFMSYTLGVQVIVLASLRRGEVRALEWAVMFGALFVWSRIAFDVPSPIGGREAMYANVDFYGGWSDRTVTTGWRALEWAAFVALGQAVRVVSGRGREPVHASRTSPPSARSAAANPTP